MRVPVLGVGVLAAACVMHARSLNSIGEACVLSGVVEFGWAFRLPNFDTRPCLDRTPRPHDQWSANQLMQTHELSRKKKITIAPRAF